MIFENERGLFCGECVDPGLDSVAGPFIVKVTASCAFGGELTGSQVGVGGEEL